MENAFLICAKLIIGVLIALVVTIAEIIARPAVLLTRNILLTLVVGLLCAYCALILLITCYARRLLSANTHGLITLLLVGSLLSQFIPISVMATICALRKAHANTRVSAADRTGRSGWPGGPWQAGRAG